MKLWNTSRYFFSQCKIYHITCQFLFFKQGTSDVEPSQVHCMLKAACATQLQGIHLHRLWCEWQPPLPLQPLYKQIVQCSSPELPHTPSVLVPDCIGCSSGLMHDCYPGSSLTVIVNFPFISFCVLFPVFWVLAFLVLGSLWHFSGALF